MKKGFTLIELLGVIVIIGILALITVPAVDSVVKKGKQRAYDMTKDTIISAAKNWLTDNKNLFADGDTLTLTLSDLKEQGYLDFDIKNPSSGVCLDNRMEVSITRNEKKYSYVIINEELVDGASNDCEAVSITPSIYLLGANPLNIEINTSFTDPGAKAISADGNDISSNIITTGIVDTSILADNIKYKYTILSDGITKTITRKINVVDTEAPVISGATDKTILDTASSFDLLAGISATDNSGETINVVVKSSFSLGVVGKYKVFYIATDSSGNTSTVSRTITVLSNCFTFNSTTGTITGYTWDKLAKCPMDVVIPAEIDGVPVRYITDFAFDGENKINKLTSVDFSNATNLTQIGDYSFNSITVNDLGNTGAFSHNLIQSINFGSISNLRTIGNNAFLDNQITSIVLPNGVIELDTNAFAFNTLNSYTLPNTLTSIGTAVFGNNLITSLTLPSSLTTIYSDAFADNKFTNLVIPNTVTTIGDSAFEDNQINKVTLSSSMTTLSSELFKNNKITSIGLVGSGADVEIPSNITTIDGALFITFTGSTSSSNGDGAFCSNLITSIKLPSTVTTIGNLAFNNNKIKTVGAVGSGADFEIPASITTINKAILQNNPLTTVNIPNTVTTINDYQMGWTSSATPITINIPASVTTISSNGFYGTYANTLIINISKASGSIAGSPWGASNATVNWLG